MNAPKIGAGMTYRLDAYDATPERWWRYDLGSPTVRGRWRARLLRRLLATPGVQWRITRDWTQAWAAVAAHPEQDDRTEHSA